MATQWMAEEPVVYLRPDGTRHEGHIALGTPFRDVTECACEYSLRGMDDFESREDRRRLVRGDSTLQALLLAATLVGRLLEAFRERGGRVLYPPGKGGDDVDVPLEALLGNVLRPPPSSGG